MKPLYLASLLFFTLAISEPCMAQGHPESTASKLESIVQTPEIASFFEGVFNHLGVTIAETGEQLTLHHEGKIIRIEEGMDPKAVDFVLPLNLMNIDHLLAFTKDGKFDEVEATNVAKVFFTPFTKVTLQNPVLTENRKRRAAGIEDFIHVYLIYPDSTTATAHTLIYAANQWVVIDEIIGKPRRTFVLTQGPALEYQRKVFHAIQEDSRSGWLSFVKWYTDWRKAYSVKH